MDGSWFIFYPSGALAGKAEYKMGTGKQIGYEESGYKCLEVPYVDNLKHGKEIYYNPDGTITKIVEYEKGKVISEDNNPQNKVE
jgi:antitoxin component YwqK of YwqJK toxin-antitoxin module